MIIISNNPASPKTCPRRGAEMHEIMPDGLKFLIIKAINFLVMGNGFCVHL